MPDADAPRTAHGQPLYAAPRDVRLRRLLALSGAAPRLLVAGRAPRGVHLALVEPATGHALHTATLGADAALAPTALAALDPYVAVATSASAGGLLWLVHAASLQAHHSLALPGRVGALLAYSPHLLLVAVGPELRLYDVAGAALTEVARLAHPSGLPLQSIARSVSRIVLGTQRDGLVAVAYDEPARKLRAAGADRVPRATADAVALSEEEAAGVDKYGHMWLTGLPHGVPDVPDAARSLPSLCTFPCGEGAVRLLRTRLSVAADAALVAVGRLGALTAFVPLPPAEALALAPVAAAMRASALAGPRVPAEGGVLDGDAVARFLRLTPAEQCRVLFPSDASPAAAQQAAEIAMVARQALQRVY